MHGAASRGRGLVSESGWLGLRGVRREGGGGGAACEGVVGCDVAVSAKVEISASASLA